MTNAQAVLPKTNLFALIGFIAAFVIPPVGMVLGAMATRQIMVTREGGRGLARAAVIVGLLGTLLQIGFFVIWFTLFFTAFGQFPRG